ncbi:hypothetical protein BaRGS_00015777, partial [Batillaria attramentaria]
QQRRAPCDDYKYHTLLVLASHTSGQHHRNSRGRVGGSRCELRCVRLMIITILKRRTAEIGIVRQVQVSHYDRHTPSTIFIATAAGRMGLE